MVDVGHCKIAYDAQDDMDEYESFYDFSRSYVKRALLLLLPLVL